MALSYVKYAATIESSDRRKDMLSICTRSLYNELSNYQLMWFWPPGLFILPVNVVEAEWAYLIHRHPEEVFFFGL